MPFTTREAEVVAKGASRPEIQRATRIPSPAWACSSSLFMGIEIGVGLLLMRRLGLWKRLRAAPVSRALLLGSRIVSGTLIASILLAAIYAAAIAFFSVRIEGSIAGFVLVAVSFAILTSTMGCSSPRSARLPSNARPRDSRHASLVMLGGAWSRDVRLPEWLQDLTIFVPTRWAIDGLEAMTWRGLGFDAALQPRLRCSPSAPSAAGRR